MARRTARLPKKTESLQESTGKTHSHAGLIVSVLLALILGGIPFALGRYIELNSPDPFDSSAYVYSARHLLDGARLGVDEVTTAYPDTLLVNLIGVKLFGFNDVGPKIVQLILQTAALVFLFFTLYRFFGPAAAVVSTVTAAIYLSAPLIAKGGNVKEQFMIAFMMAAACAFIHYAWTGRKRWLLLCGFFAMQPYYFKPTGFSIFMVLAGYLFVSGIASRNFKKLLMDLALFAGGTAAGLLVPAILYIWQGKMSSLMKTLPAMTVKLMVVLLIAAAVIYYAAIFCRRIELWKQLKSAHRRIYKIGAITLITALVAAVLTIAAANVYYTNTYDYAASTVGQDLGSYFWNMPLTGLPMKLPGTVAALMKRLFGAAGLGGGYVANSWKLVEFSDVAAKILRYYKALSVPILLAVASIVTAAFVTVRQWKKKQPLETHDRLAWGLAAWWFLDMAFVWGSPHSYEQYYLPLCASAAVLAAYAVWRWQRNLKAATFKLPWLAAGAVAAVILTSLSIPIFIGQRFSPDTGADYTAGGGGRRRGFDQALAAVKEDKKGFWELAGEYIRANSSPDDKIYVWGWFPGIYVEAGRMAPVPQAYEADMHFTPPQTLLWQAMSLVRGFEKNPPKFIVDSRKLHFPFNRPPLELWPIVPPKMLGNEQPRLLDASNPQEVERFNAAYRKYLNDSIEPDEAGRYDAMEPLRKYVMANYRFVRQFREHMVFERKQ